MLETIKHRIIKSISIVYYYDRKVQWTYVYSVYKRFKLINVIINACSLFSIRFINKIYISLAAYDDDVKRLTDYTADGVILTRFDPKDAFLYIYTYYVYKTHICADPCRISAGTTIYRWCKTIFVLTVINGFWVQTYILHFIYVCIRSP